MAPPESQGNVCRSGRGWTENAKKRSVHVSVGGAIMAVERLKKLLRDPDASNADALKAATLIFERVYPTPQTGAAAGDFDICIKEE